MGFSIASFYGLKITIKGSKVVKLKATTKTKKRANEKISSNVAFNNKILNKTLQKDGSKSNLKSRKTFNKKRDNKMRQHKEFKFNSVLEFWNIFRTPKDCYMYLEEYRWAGQPESPFDSTSKVYKCKDGRYKCKNTNKYFTVLTGTIFEKSKIPIQAWFYAIYCLTNTKNGKSARQIAKDINISYYRTLKMLHKIREHIFGAENYNVLDGVVLTDETFVGGKDKNRHWDKKARNAKQNDDRTFVDKIPVVGYMNKETGLLTAVVIPSVSANVLLHSALTYIKPGAIIYSDDWKGYKDFCKFYEHYIVEHGKKIYVNGEVTTNKLEGAWTQLKRMLATYHHVSPRYLQLYVNEFVYRYNTLRMQDNHRFSWGLQLSEKQKAA